MDRSKWEYKKLGDCFAYIKNGANIKQISGATGIPITRIETLSNDVFNRDRMGYANIDDVTTYSSNILNDGDILMSHINSMKFLGRAVEYKKIDEEVIIHGMNLLRMIPTSNFLSSYAVYQFKTDHFRKQVKAISHQAVNQASFNVTNLKGLNLIVPPIADQQRIVAELDCLNEMIALKQEQLKEFDKLAQSIFYDMFGDPVVNENGWGMCPLGHLLKVLGGYAYKSTSYVEDGVKLVQIANVWEDAIKWDDVTCVSYNDAEIHPNYILSSGDVVMALTRPIIKSLGTVKIARVRDCDLPCVLNQRVCKFDFLDSTVLPLWFYHFARTSYFKDKINTFSSKGMQPNVSTKEIEGIPTPIIPLALQQQFAEKIQAIEAQKELVKKSIAETQQLLDSRMDYYFD